VPGRQQIVTHLPLAVIFLCTAIIVMLWSAIVYDGSRSRTTAMEEARRDLTNLVIASRENVAGTVGAIDQLLLAITAAHATHPGEYRIPDWIERSPLIRGLLFQITLIAPDGIIRGSSMGGEGQDMSDRPHFRYHLDPSAAQPFISVPLLGRVSRKWSVQFTRRLTDADGRFDGVVVISLDPFHLSQFFESLNLGENGSAILAGRDGIVRARRALNNQQLGQDIGDALLFEHLRTAPSGTFVARSGIDGIERVFGYTALPDYPLVISLGFSTDAVLASSRRQRNTYLVAGGTGTFGIVAVTWILLRESNRRRREELEAHARVRLQEQREFLDRVIENVPATIFVKDTSRRFVLVNRSGEKLWGLGRDQVIGKTTEDIFPPATAELVREHDDKLLATDSELFVQEHPVETPANGTRWVTGRRLCIRRADGTPQYLLGVLEDVTQRRAVEQQLRQAQKMEAVGNLTGGMAHDFNNLLLIMIGNLDLLAAEVADNPAAAEMVETILEAGLRGAELTRQMLAFSRRQPLQPRTIAINALIDNIMKMLARTLGENIELRVHATPSLPSVFIDAAQLEAALVNIAINARDAMANGGRLTVETAIAEVDARTHPEMRPGEHVVIAITDTGTGMPPDVLSRIFEPFFTTKPKGKGTGLGLSMVYGFVTQSGGNITAYSEVGRGTTFRIYIPAAPDGIRSSVVPRIAEEVPLAPGREVILAVDDNPGVRATVRGQLAELGYRVEIANDGEAALRKIEAGMHLDLLFTDVVMPGMNGKELARRAQQLRPDLKVLFTSGFPGTSLTGVDLEPGDALLSKPYRKRDLAKKIREILGA
jgi:PAS domain S-box-containing protein